METTRAETLLAGAKSQDAAQTAVLSSLQMTLRTALAARDPRLADMYFGALVVLTQNGNPERFSHSAQSFREIVTNLSYVEGESNMGAKVKDLQSGWVKAKRKHGPEALAAFAHELDGFFRWVDNCRPSLSQQAAKIIDDLDPMIVDLPKHIMEAKAKQWVHFRQYFQQVAHHKHSPSEADFKEQADSFAAFLLDLLRPKTSEDFAQIEQLIREADQAL